MRLFSNKSRKLKAKRPPRIRIPRPTPEQLRLSMPHVWQTAPAPTFDAYPGLIDDPIGGQERAETRFAMEQLNAGKDILQSGRGIETAADEQNVRAAKEAGFGYESRLDADCDPLTGMWRGETIPRSNWIESSHNTSQQPLIDEPVAYQMDSQIDVFDTIPSITSPFDDPVTALNLPQEPVLIEPLQDAQAIGPEPPPDSFMAG